MKLKLYKLKLIIKEKLLDFWYWLMKPLAYFYTIEKENARYKKKQDRITEEQAVKYIAEDIAKYIVKYGKRKIIIAEWFDTDYFTGVISLNYIHWSILKRKKVRMGYYKLNKTIENQEKIIEKLKHIKGILVTEEIEKFKWEKPRGYVRTCYVEYIG